MKALSQDLRRSIGARRPPTPRASCWSIILAALLGCAAFTQGCAGSHQIPRYTERTQSKSAGTLRVTVAVPTPAEAETIYGRNLADRGIQPVWVEVENHGPAIYWMLETG